MPAPRRRAGRRSVALLGRPRPPSASFPVAATFLFNSKTGLYQDTARTTPVTADSQAVKGWADESGSGLHVSEGASNPVSQSVGGDLVALFDGTKWLKREIGAGVDAPAFSLHILARKTAPLNGNGCPLIAIGDAGIQPFVALNWTTYSNSYYAPAVGSIDGTPCYEDAGNTHLYSYCRDASGMDMLCDGVLLNTVAAGGAPSFADIWLGYTGYGIGGQFSAGLFVGDMASKHTPSQCASLASWCRTNFPGFYPRYSQGAAWDWNSLGEGFWTNGNELVASYLASLTIGLDGWWNVARGGTTLSQKLAAFPTRVLPLLDQMEEPGTVFLWETTNEIVLNGTSAAAMLEMVDDYRGLVHAAGHKLIVGTCLPRKDGAGGAIAGFEDKRLAFNSGLNGDPSLCDAVADVGGDATIGTVDAPLNTTNYADQVHLTAAGQAIAAPYWSDAHAEAWAP